MTGRKVKMAVSVLKMTGKLPEIHQKLLETTGSDACCCSHNFIFENKSYC